jgi:hypothetical protein
VVQVTNKKRPTTAREAALMPAAADAMSGCFRPLIAEIQSVRPDLAAVISNDRADGLQLDARLVERRITWAEAVHQSQRTSSETYPQMAAAN